MLSKNLIKLIHSLEMKKFRKEHNLFVAEGEKLVKDLLTSAVECEKIIATEQFAGMLQKFGIKDAVIVNEEELKKASFLRTPQGIIGLFKQKSTPLDPSVPQHELCLALDDVQDPGNLGTIVRIADWFGIKNIYCSNGTADAFSPKTVQATMGALARVKLHYCDLKELISKLDDVPVFGTFLDGKNIYENELSANGLIMMGNEGNGISKEVSELINKRILIPNYPQGNETSESLNVAIATAIVCSEFRRRQI